jgi:hypothetical protein
VGTYKLDNLDEVYRKIVYFYVDNYRFIAKRFCRTIIPNNLKVYVDFSSADFIYQLNKKAKLLFPNFSLTFMKCKKDPIFNRVLAQ